MLGAPDSEMILQDLTAVLSLLTPCFKLARDTPASDQELCGSETLWGQLILGSVTQQGSFWPWCFLAAD